MLKRRNKQRRNKQQWDLAGKVVVIAGATRGLGLELSRQLTRAGAHLAICGRDELRLAAARAELQSQGADFLAERCDVTDAADVATFVSHVLARHGAIDAVINCAGVLAVGPATALTEGDYREAMDVMYLGPVRMNAAVLPIMLRQGRGRIVNIASLGGEVGMPRMGAYCGAKAALEMYSRGLAAELAGEGIVVTTVVPGFMRTGAHINGRFMGDHEGEYAWFSLSSSLPAVSIPADAAARRIIRAMQRGEREVLVGPLARTSVFFMRNAHWLTDAALRVVHRVLPGTHDRNAEAYFGFQSTTALSESLLTKLGRDAAKVYRQYGPVHSIVELKDWREPLDYEEAA